MKTLFIYDPDDLDSPIPGGVQLCSKEFLDIVREASEVVEMLPVSVTRRPVWRLRRKLGLGSYLFYHPDEARESLDKAVRQFAPTHVFINRCELLRLAPLVKEVIPDAKVIFMSHGNQTGDDLYEVTGYGGGKSFGTGRFVGTWRLGMDLVTESHYRRRHIDGMCVMSNEEKVIERWMGANQVVVLPRLIGFQPLDWEPVKARVGFVGTLNHTPNRIALEQLCEQLVERGESRLEFRLVGGPEEEGRLLAEKFPFIHYLGRLDDEDLKQEATSWSLFLNPIFWLSRGASMKLGQSLSWGIPVITTQAGMRGYELEKSQLVVTEDTPVDFVSKLIKAVTDPGTINKLREEMTRQSKHWPDTGKLAAKIAKKFGT